MSLGVVVVTYNAEDVIAQCLASLASSVASDLRVVVVDNASKDDTCQRIQQWASGAFEVGDIDGIFSVTEPVRTTLIECDSNSEDLSLDTGQIALVRLRENLGFAGGVNVGIKSLLRMPMVEAIWILNPDCVVEATTAQKLIETAHAVKPFGVIGGRIYYSSPKLMIQSDGGRISLWTGTCYPFNMTAIGRDIRAPEDSELDYIPGTHMVVSREFIQHAGLMPEQYFLYYEEMEWCLRRGKLPLVFAANAPVHHIGGHTAGSATINNRPSPLAAYFMARNRIRFIARMRPAALPVAFFYGIAKALRCLWRKEFMTALAMFRGLLGMGPTRKIKEIIGRATLPS